MSSTPQSERMVAVTMGDPGGIGGEITIKAWEQRRTDGPAFLLICDPSWIEEVVGNIGASAPIVVIDKPADADSVFADALPILPISGSVSGKPGSPAANDAAMIIESIETAVDLCQRGVVAGVATNPISKKSLYSAGFAFPGHTEFIADQCNIPHPVMMLASPMLRVVPATIHRPLRDAIGDINADLIERVGRTVSASLHQDFGIETPRIAIAGLNPHAGEDGTLGREDGEFIAPAIESLRTSGLNVSGPVPADALFTPRSRETFDAAICMYHDQALIPIKALDFDRAVNVTLGLPIVRTSPDHGTAFDIAGTGKANPTSLISAIELAGEIALHRRVSG